jgi:putative addiction module CopG family antidote
MSTISVPLPANLEEFVNRMVKSGNAANKADVVRKALRRMSDEEAVNSILEAQREISSGKGLKGDLRELAKKYK